MIVRAENLCHQAIFMDHASGAVAPPDAKVILWGSIIGSGLVEPPGDSRPVQRTQSAPVPSKTR